MDASPLSGLDRTVRSAVTALVLALVGLGLAAGSALGAETVYWNNYKGEPATIAFANIDGTGGGALNTGGLTLGGPEGMAIDTVTGKLYTSDTTDGPGGKSKLVAVNLDGSGAAIFAPAGATIEEPYGVAIDPVTRTLYWTNTEGGPGNEGSIGWAKLDGSAAGVLAPPGAVFKDTYKIAIDPVGKRVFWGNNKTGEESIGFAMMDNSSGGVLDLSGATPPNSLTGLAVDPVAKRIYWVDNEGVSYAGLSGGGGGDVPLAENLFNDPYGLAFDPTLSKLYWGNYDNDEDRTNAIGSGTLAGVSTGINIATAPLNGPQDPLILKSPTGTKAPAATRDAKVAAKLTCAAPEWAADFAGSFVYQAPTTVAYQWTRNGAPVAGGTATTLTAKSAGKYACVATGTNQAGSAVQTSAAVNVKASKVKLKVKKKAKVKAGGKAVFKVKASNTGDLATKGAKVCVKVAKKAKAFVKAPKCKSIGKVKGRGKDSAKLTLKVKPGAKPGTYGVTFKVTGAKGKPAKSKLVVTAP